jgi:hypothetical protein
VVWNLKETKQTNGKQMISYGIYPSLHYRQQEGPEKGWSVVGSNDFNIETLFPDLKVAFLEAMEEGNKAVTEQLTRVEER